MLPLHPYFDGYITLNGGYCFNENGVYYKEPIVKKETKAKNSSSINDFIDEESYNSSSSTSTSKSSNQESSVLDDWFIWSMMQNND